jgi:hypothetical protein
MEFIHHMIYIVIHLRRQLRYVTCIASCQIISIFCKNHILDVIFGQIMLQYVWQKKLNPQKVQVHDNRNTVIKHLLFIHYGISSAFLHFTYTVKSCLYYNQTDIPQVSFNQKENKCSYYTKNKPYPRIYKATGVCSLSKSNKNDVNYIWTGKKDSASTI